VKADSLCHVNLARGYRGGERQTELLIKELAARGIEQRLVCRRDSPLVSRLAECDGLNIRTVAKPFIFHLSAVRDGAVVHAHENKAGKLAYYGSRRWGVPYVLTRRVPQVPSRRWPSDAVYRGAARVVAVSRAVSSILRQRFPNLDVAVVPDAHGHLAADAMATEHLRGSFAQAFLVGHVAALQDRHKGQRVLIEAARHLAHAGSRALILFIGSGPDAEALQAEASELDNVLFTGFVDNVADYLAMLDIAVMPSRYEAMGSALLDAMHFGVPVVASNTGGIPEIVEHGANGLLVPPNDVAGFAQAILRLENDRQIRARMGECGRRMAAAYGPDRMADRYLAIYRRLGFHG